MTFIPASPTPADLWQDARQWLADALRRFAGPAGIAATLARRTRTAIARRLAALESLVAKLLLIQAAHLCSSPACGGGRELPRKREEREGGVRTRPSVSRCALDSSPQSGEHNARFHRSEDPADPSSWRVRFHARIPRDRARACALRPAPSRAAAPATPQQRAHQHARRLARRFEALARAIANPHRAARRLAAKLRALGARAYAAARRIALWTPVRRRRERRSHAHALVHACDASEVFHADTT